jgi:hypothetical protein
MSLRVALLLTAGTLLAAAPAQAVIPPGNLLQNPGAEDGPGATNTTDAPPPPGWEVAPNFTAVQYGVGAFPDTSVSAAISGGQNFFAGGPDNGAGVSGAFQEVSLSGAAREIDAAGEQMTLSGHLGGFAGQDDSVTVVAVFQDASDNGLGGLSLIGPDASERNLQTGFVRRASSGPIPPGTRKATVVIQAVRQTGPYNDGYADNLNLSFGADPGPPPDFKETASVSTVRGFILVRERGSNRFRPLQAGEELPLGSEVDASNGEVQVTTAANASGETQSGRFGGGAFTMRQVGGASPVTELSMKRGNPGVCRRIGGRRVRAAARRIRRLSGNARGRFRTRGRHSSATVRGTRWVMEDRCNGTLTRVLSGSVTVRDFAKRRNVVVRRGRRYLAKPRRR